MLKNSFIYIFLLFSFLFYFSNVLAVNAGTIDCRITGNVDKTSGKITSQDVSIVVSRDENTMQFEFNGDASSKREELSVFILANLFDINFNSLLTRKIQTSVDNQAEIFVEKLEFGSDNVVETVNLTEDKNQNPVKSLVSLQFLRFRDNKATGNIRIRFPKTISKSTLDQTPEGENDSFEKLIVTCKFRDVPVLFDNWY